MALPADAATTPYPPPSYEMAHLSGTAAPGVATNGQPLPTQTQPAAPHRSYRGGWKVSCLGICCSNPGLCCYAELCLPCLLMTQRRQLMNHHSPPLTEYTCCLERVGGQYLSKYCLCNGPYPIDSTGGQCCLFCEACLCFFGTVPAHRREIQDQYGVDMGKEEWPAHVVACASWIPFLGIAGGCLVGFFAYCCYACLAAQQQVEIDTQGAPPPGPAKQVMA